MPKKVKPHQKKSIIAQYAESKSSVTTMSDDFFVISMRHLVMDKGDSWDSWQEQNILARAINTISNYCKSSLRSQVDGEKFTIYGDFPPDEKTEFTYPKHVPPDAEWARIHITGKQCIIGHVVNNTFYITFLDGEHKFWKSQLKNT